MVRRGWTLIEVLVVVSLITLLMGILLPSLRGARTAAQRMACMANLRSLEQAHWAYLTESNGRMLGTSHSGSWIRVLRQYSETLLLRSPLDKSPHFEGGIPVDGKYRETSYALNFWLSPDNPAGYGRVEVVRRPSSIVHYVIKVFEGPNAIADHVHPQLWYSPIPGATPGKAALEVQTNAYGGDKGTWDAMSGYGFLDGHAEALRFRQVYKNLQHNHFDPGASP